MYHVREGVAYRINNGAVYDAKKRVYRAGVQRKGVPDIIGIIDGRFIGIEVKIGKDRQSADQKEIEKGNQCSWRRVFHRQIVRRLHRKDCDDMIHDSHKYGALTELRCAAELIKRELARCVSRLWINPPLIWLHSTNRDLLRFKSKAGRCCRAAMRVSQRISTSTKTSILL